MYFRQGMEYLHQDRLDEAVKYFTRAIEHDPHSAEAYRHRGEVYNLLGRVVEANADLQKARALKPSAAGPKKVSWKVNKIDLQSVENIHGDLLAIADREGDEAIDFDGRVFDYVFSDDTLESD